jgi:DNA replication protein DnaC
MNTETATKRLDQVLARAEYTLSELKERDFPIDPDTTPPPFVCEFCQSEIDPCAIVLAGLVFWKMPYCGCEKGLEKYQERIAQQEREAAEEEARKRQAELDDRARRILSNSGINSRFLSRTFDSFQRDTPKREKAYTDALYYANHFEKTYSKDGTGLYIEGTFGTGKTHLAVAIALYLIRHGVNVICKTSIDMLMDIKAAFRYEGGEEEKTARYKHCALLVIDDLGKEQCTDWSLPKLYEIINDRYEKCKPTIITTNYSHDELTRRLVPKGGDSMTAGALVSRLKESAIVMSMVWSDYREGGK